MPETRDVSTTSHIRRTLPVLSALLIPAIALGCAGEEQGATSERAAGAEAAAAESPALPDTTGAAVWAYLQDVAYTESWDLWPGKGELYEGQEPHGMLLTTYLNPEAHQALTGDAASFPPGAIIVKENYTPDSTLAAVTTMYKVDGYSPEAGDWFWVKHLPDGSVDADGNAQGRVKGCIACHSGKRDNDYIYTGQLVEAGGGG